MSVLNALQIVESFWADVWVAGNPEAVDRYVVDDFVITSAGKRFGQGMPSSNGYASFRRESPVLNRAPPAAPGCVTLVRPFPRRKG
jgi:hypothetical protein